MDGLKHKVEVFTAECPLCVETLKTVREATKDCGCEVVEYTCKGLECCEPAQRYGIKAMPSIVVDGKIAHEGRLSAETCVRDYLFR